MDSFRPKQLPVVPPPYRPNHSPAALPPQVKSPAQLKAAVRRPTPIQRASMSSPAVFGFSQPETATAAREQLMPDSCWAAAVATAAQLLKKTDYANEIKIFRIGKAAGLTLPSGRLKGAECFKSLSASLTGLKLAAYEPAGAFANIPKWLGEKKVILLCSAQHVVVLAGMSVTGGPSGTYTFQLIDPASPGVKSVGFETLKNFKDAVVVVEAT